MYRRLPAALLLLATLVLPASATWSIVVANRRTGEVGLAAATCLAGDNLKRGLPCVIVGKGAGVNQFAGVASNIVVMGVGFRSDSSPEEIMDLVRANQPQQANLQAGIVSLTGPPVTFSGGAVDPARLGLVGEVGDLSYAIQGNSLAGQEVILAAEAALLGHDGDLGQKLLAAMQAAREFGGDGRCSCSFQNPNGCGSPPREFEKSAHVAILTVARIGDSPAPCTGPNSCVTGSYYLFRNIKGTDGLPDDPDPVAQLHGRYANWRAAHVGRPDGILSEVTGVDSIPADGVASRVVTILLRDIDGVPLAQGGADVRVESLDGARLFSHVSAVTDHDDGTYSFKLEAGQDPGTDTLVITATDDSLTATLFPYLEVWATAPRTLHSGFDFISARRGGQLPFVVHEPARAGGHYQVFARAVSVGAGRARADVSTRLAIGMDGGLLLAGAGVLDADGRAESWSDVPPHALGGLEGGRLEWRALIVDRSGVTVTPPIDMVVRR